MIFDHIEGPVKDLINEAARHESIASKVQKPQAAMGAGLSEEDINAFINEYLVWYGECIANLPEDLRDRFRAAYENPNYCCIQRFIESPLETTIEYDDNNWENSIGFPAWKYTYDTCFRKPLLTQKQILIEAVKRQGKTNNFSKDASSSEAIMILEKFAKNFHLVVHQLEHRYDNRLAITTIKDEYDIQNLFHVLLTSVFDDIRPEEWVPSYAGKSSRTDFLLKAEQIVVEIKKTRTGLSTGNLSDQLIIDKERYRSHPDCKTLFVFVYDPDRKIINPRGIEKDLSTPTGNVIVHVIINQG